MTKNKVKQPSNNRFGDFPKLKRGVISYFSLGCFGLGLFSLLFKTGSAFVSLEIMTPSICLFLINQIYQRDNFISHLLSQYKLRNAGVLNKFNKTLNAITKSNRTLYAYTCATVLSYVFLLWDNATSMVSVVNICACLIIIGVSLLGIVRAERKNFKLSCEIWNQVQLDYGNKPQDLLELKVAVKISKGLTL